MLRILGCLLGAAPGIAAIVYLIPSITSIGALMVVVFLGALVSAWVAAGSPRIACAGFQIAFAFFLCVIQGSAPSFDMTDGQGPRDRHFAWQSCCLYHIRQYLAGERRKAHRSRDRRSPAVPGWTVDGG
jgi:Fusaric acid resistance protein family